MDFSSLPDTALLRIFEYFPLKEQIRLSQVSKSFRRFSQLTTSRTKSIDLTEDQFRNLSPIRFDAILDLCSKNLERIKFPDCFSAFQCGPECVSILANYHCQRLVDVDIDYVNIENDTFGQLIRNNRSIKSLRWRRDFYPENEIYGLVDYPDVTLDDLKVLTLSFCNDDTFRSMTGRCPNLVSADLITKDISIGIFDQFLASIRQIRQISLHLFNNDIAFEDLVNLWNRPLTSLNIAYSGGTVFANDAFLYKVATRLPKLKTLELSCSMEMSSEGVSYLGNLQELEMLDLFLPHDLDDGIRGLARCGRLQKLFLPVSSASTASLVNLLRSCPQLRLVVIRDAPDVDCPEMAVVFLEALSGMAKRNVTIGFYKGFMQDEEEAEYRSIWESETVKQMIKHLEDSEGLVIEIDCITSQEGMLKFFPQ